MPTFVTSNETHFGAAYTEAVICIANAIPNIGVRRKSWLDIAVRDIDSAEKYADTPEEKILVKHLRAAYDELVFEKLDH